MNKYHAALWSSPSSTDDRYSDVFVVVKSHGRGSFKLCKQFFKKLESATGFQLFKELLTQFYHFRLKGLYLSQ